uniref:Endothelin-converting enzyme 2 n=1 Tax=Caligus rogercresseyi TaxID=217165 RepID=C1BQT7_CALRO|nr:Endothelin-converting enzyme 2 [Caligus rogercresseyi]
MVLDNRPASNTDYSKSEYWESRYAQEKDEEFEWLGNYEAFREYLLPGLCSSKDSVLILGCGNSTLGPDMVIMDGFKDVTSIDISESIIRQQKQKYKDFSSLKWSVMDITNLSLYEKEAFDVVIEKATLDAFIASERSPWSLSENTVRLIHKACSETSRVLKKGGLFLSLTFAQPHFRLPLYGKESYDWSLSFTKVSGLDSSLDFYLYRMVKGESLKSSVNYSSIAKFIHKGTEGLSNLRITEVDNAASSSDEEEGFLGKFYC